MYNEYVAQVEHAYRTERFRREAANARLARRTRRHGLGGLLHPKGRR